MVPNTAAVQSGASKVSTSLPKLSVPNPLTPKANTKARVQRALRFQTRRVDVSLGGVISLQWTLQCVLSCSSHHTFTPKEAREHRRLHAICRKHGAVKLAKTCWDDQRRLHLLQPQRQVISTSVSGTTSRLHMSLVLQRAPGCQEAAVFDLPEVRWPYAQL